MFHAQDTRLCIKKKKNSTKFDKVYINTMRPSDQSIFEAVMGTANILEAFSTGRQSSSSAKK